MHDIRQLLGEYLMNQMLQSNNVVDTILGHMKIKKYRSK